MNRKTFLKAGTALFALFFVLMLWVPAGAAEECASEEQVASSHYYTRNNESFVGSYRVTNSVGGYDIVTVNVIMNIGYYYEEGIYSEIVYCVPISWSADIRSLGSVNCSTASEFEVKDGGVNVKFTVNGYSYSMRMYLDDWGEPCATLKKIS